MSLEDLQKYYMDQPFEVSIETFAKCNANCSFCPYETLERKGEKMPDELIDRLIDEMATFEKPFYFSPFKVSEPLLDKRLHSILKKVNEKVPQAKIRIFTNGSALNHSKAEELHDIDNLELWVSFNEHREMEYKNLMNLDYQRTLKNIDHLHETDFRHQVIILRVGVDPEFRKFCENRWPDFTTVMIKKDGWIDYTQADLAEVPDTQCGRWYELSIMANGIVSLCCMDGKGEYSIGDVNKQTMLEIYNSDTKRQHTSRAEINPCSRCTY